MKLKEAFKKKGVKVTTIVASVLLIGAIIVMSIFLPFKKGTPSGEIWSPIKTFELSKDAVVLEKQAGKEFTILNFADIQAAYASELNKNSLTYKTMVKTVEEVKPDLITMTGDNIWGKLTVQRQRELIKIMDGFNIPWAPVYGNHDREGNCDLDYMGEVFSKAKNCLFRKGPENIGGIGNYVIAIKEGNKIVHTLVMIDSGSGRDYDNLDEKEYTYSSKDPKTKLGKGYDFIDTDQIEWYKWSIKGIAAYNEVTTAEVKSTAMFHIPLLQYAFAYEMWEASGFDPAIGSGRLGEPVASAYVDTGMFAAIKELGSTKAVIVGHDHVNDFNILYEGVNLVYGVKTGDCCYWTEDGSMNGGTVLHINADNSTTIEQHYVRI